MVRLPLVGFVVVSVVVTTLVGGCGNKPGGDQVPKDKGVIPKVGDSRMPPTPGPVTRLSEPVATTAVVAPTAEGIARPPQGVPQAPPPILGAPPPPRPPE